MTILESRALYRVMVCTESSRLSNQLISAFQKQGYKAAAAADVESLQLQITTTHPDAIVCDRDAFGDSQLSVIKTIRNIHTKLATVPIIIVSSAKAHADIINAKLAGADDYIVKPVNTELLIASVDAQIRIVLRIRSSISTETQNSKSDAIKTEAVFHKLLDRLSFGIIIYNAGGQVAFRNQTAKRLTPSDAAVIRGWMMQLVTKDSYDEPKADNVHRSVMGFRIIPTGASHDDTTHNLFVTLLKLSDDSTSEQYFGTAIFSSLYDGDLGAKMISSAFGLTPTESRFACLLATGMRPDKIGEVMGIARPTISYHLRNIFQKSGSSRQSELVSLLRTVHLTETNGTDPT